jgi:DNA transformation protein and related proteins
MPCSPTFVDHVLDLLSPLGPVAPRRLFGGYGLYARGVMFALLDDDELFLKTDAESLPRFRERDCRMWVWASDGPATDYFRPPDEAHEDPEAMEPWARLGLEAALRVKGAKAAKAAAAAARRVERERKKAAGEKPRVGVKAKVGAKGTGAARKAPRRKAPSRGRSRPR